MAKQRLTDRQRISGVTLTDLLHFVVTGDTSQSPAGSSYKGEVEQLFDAFSSYTCTNPLFVETVNACNSGITINGNVTINGSATTINTEVIQSKDNNIILNYSGTHATALYGGITVEDGQSEGVDSLLFIDEDGCWHADPGFCDLTVDGVAFTAQTPYLFVDDGSVNSITTRYTGNTITNSDYSNIGGGRNNSLYNNTYSIIGGGNENTINTTGPGIGNSIIVGLGNTISGYGYGGSNLIVGGGSGYFGNIGNTIDGGTSNVIVGGGNYVGNTISGGSYNSIIVGGEQNVVGGGYNSTIVGGSYNVTSAVSSFIGGGSQNKFSSPGNGSFGVIVGGWQNEINGTVSSNLVFIGGGFQNVVGNEGRYGVIAGGRQNTMTGSFGGGGSSVIGGGQFNDIVGSDASFIGGGSNNTITSGSSSVIVGGAAHNINSIISFIGGGSGNQINGDGRSSIVGGINNLISGQDGFIGGGSSNSITDKYSSLAGGKQNDVYSTYSFIGGGRLNVINNTFSSIVGGSGNTINHTNSHIIGTTITSISANTTHVERLNIGTVDTGSTATEVLVRETNGMVNTTPFSTVSGGLNGKYVELITGYTANVTQTITHNLGTGDEVVVDVIDTTNNERIGSVIDNYQTNELDLTLSQNYASIKIVIIG